ncbi:3-dehydroquinate synthase AroB [Candidatus Paraburkholderia kirkii UZHbot1]|uniref:3-dehydroquinate synthase AroB n=1 Tax=Candidatus Paraburkholderia kirkii UZHbot1 TaxID=1055526 RepID=G4ME14_9BURK|nr:3-dehydroquinate synthase AroB [Candidatus Paraburkholderia kirkii UZHbot1]
MLTALATIGRRLPGQELWIVSAWNVGNNRTTMPSLMLEELQKNPYESHTYQRLVDMGHAFSPALEATTDFRLHHGEAVAIDMALTVTLAESLGFMRTDERNRFIAALVQAGLPICAPELTVELCEAALDEVVYHRGGRSISLYPWRSVDVSFWKNATACPAVCHWRFPAAPLARSVTQRLWSTIR